MALHVRSRAAYRRGVEATEGQPLGRTSDDGALTIDESAVTIRVYCFLMCRWNALSCIDETLLKRVLIERTRILRGESIELVS